MKSPEKKAILLKDYERLALWRKGVCPYCGNTLQSGANGLFGMHNDKKQFYGCNICGNHNVFSGPIVKRGLE